MEDVPERTQIYLDEKNTIKDAITLSTKQEIDVDWMTGEGDLLLASLAERGKRYWHEKKTNLPAVQQPAFHPLRGMVDSKSYELAGGASNSRKDQSGTPLQKALRKTAQGKLARAPLSVDPLSVANWNIENKPKSVKRLIDFLNSPNGTNYLAWLYEEKTGEKIEVPERETKRKKGIAKLRFPRIRSAPRVKADALLVQHRKGGLPSYFTEQTSEIDQLLVNHRRGEVAEIGGDEKDYDRIAKWVHRVGTEASMALRRNNHRDFFYLTRQARILFS